ncbi:hypothetical protein [Candidatus Nitrosotalea sp. TS]|nr:hypothetical protein [Candidatus Nitrosotalea sp. TS]
MAVTIQYAVNDQSYVAVIPLIMIGAAIAFVYVKRRKRQTSGVVA